MSLPTLEVLPVSISCLWRNSLCRAVPRPLSSSPWVSTPSSVLLPASTFPTTATLSVCVCVCVCDHEEFTPSHEDSPLLSSTLSSSSLSFSQLPQFSTPSHSHQSPRSSPSFPPTLTSLLSLLPSHSPSLFNPLSFFLLLFPAFLNPSFTLSLFLYSLLPAHLTSRKSSSSTLFLTRHSAMYPTSTGFSLSTIMSAPQTTARLCTVAREAWSSSCVRPLEVQPPEEMESRDEWKHGGHRVSIY